MELSELVSYAEEKYHIREKHKWKDFPGFSVLCDPATDRWLALLMRQWDTDRGEELQRCDIKCGQACLAGAHPSFLTKPFRMKGSRWVGVIMEETTDPAVVRQLFDEAVTDNKARTTFPAGRLVARLASKPVQEESGQQWHYSITLDDSAVRAGQTTDGSQTVPCQETAIPARKERQTSIPAGADQAAASKPVQPVSRMTQESRRNRLTARLVQDGRTNHPAENIRTRQEIQNITKKENGSAINQPERTEAHSAAAVPSQAAGQPQENAWLLRQRENVPEKILQMRHLYDYGDDSWESKCRNFYRQGKFMENYTDDAPWTTGYYKHYFTTYHDLNVPQLRGYFSWRTKLRQGEYQPIPASVAYMYLYELLCGIGAASPADTLRKMEEFETGFLDAGTRTSLEGGIWRESGFDEMDRMNLRKNLHRWMLEYAVIHQFPAQQARRYMDPSVLEKDRVLEALREPDKHTEDEVFAALCTFESRNLPFSPVVRADSFHRDWESAVAKLLPDEKRQSRWQEETGQIQEEKRQKAAGEVQEENKQKALGQTQEGNKQKEAGLTSEKKEAGLTRDEDKEKEAAGKRLFVQAWRYASHDYKENGNDLFTLCFGPRKVSIWHPLANVIYWEESTPSDADYILDGMRSYSCRKGVWREISYSSLYFNKEKFQGFVHEADRLFRRYRKTGHNLKAKPADAWADPFIQAAIDEDQKIEAQRKAEEDKISINFSELDKIRQDAAITRDSLLTEEDMETPETMAHAGSPVATAQAGDMEQKTGAARLGSTEQEKTLSVKIDPFGESLSPESASLTHVDQGLASSVTPVREGQSLASSAPLVREEQSATAQASLVRKAQDASGQAALQAGTAFGLDPIYLQLLEKLLDGKSIEDDIRSRFLLPSVVADTINEAMFDEIGDNILECDDDRIELVEDYREDVRQLLANAQVSLRTGNRVS